LVGKVGEGVSGIVVMINGGMVAVGSTDTGMGVTVGRTDVATGAIEEITVASGSAVISVFTHPVSRRKANQDGIMILR